MKGGAAHEVPLSPAAIAVLEALPQFTAATVKSAEEFRGHQTWPVELTLSDQRSNTYYFDQHHQLQRITFTGLTAEPRRLLAAVVTPNGLKSQPTTQAAAKPFNTRCPVTGEAIDPKVKTVVFDGKVIGFCCDDCVEPFQKNPEKYAKNMK